MHENAGKPYATSAGPAVSRPLLINFVTPTAVDFSLWYVELRGVVKDKNGSRRQQ